MAIRLPAWVKSLARFFSQAAPAPNLPPDDLKKQMGISILVLQEALRSSLIHLVEIKGQDGLAWLSEFQDELVRSAKNMVGEGFAMEDEIKLIDGSIQYLNFIFDGVRREIADKTK
jgi:hypothetical protein